MHRHTDFTKYTILDSDGNRYKIMSIPPAEAEVVSCESHLDHPAEYIITVEHDGPCGCTHVYECQQGLTDQINGSGWPPGPDSFLLNEDFATR